MSLRHIVNYDSIGMTSPHVFQSVFLLKFVQRSINLVLIRILNVRSQIGVEINIALSSFEDRLPKFGSQKETIRALRNFANIVTFCIECDPKYSYLTFSTVN